MENIIGGRLAAETLLERDVDFIFSLSGGHITPIYQFLENSRITIFDTRHEQAAVFMAEAWARMTRKPAVAMVTAGVGSEMCIRDRGWRAWKNWICRI